MKWFLCRQLRARGAAPGPAAGCRLSTTTTAAAAAAKIMSISEKFVQEWKQILQDGVSIRKATGSTQ